MADENSEKNTVVIDVQINDADVRARLNDLAEKITNAKKTTKDLTESNKELAKNYKVNAPLIAKNTAEIQGQKSALKLLEAEQKAYNTQLNLLEKDTISYGDTLLEQRAALENLKMVYYSLDEAQKKSAEGQDLKKSLDELTETVKGTEESVGVFSRNVGNYPQIFDLSAKSIMKMGHTIVDAGKKGVVAGAGLKGAFNGIKNSAISMGKAFLAPPIGVIVIVLGAIMAAVKLLVNAFKNNEDATNKLQNSFSFLQPILTAVGKAFSLLADAVATFVGWIGKAVEVLIKFNPYVLAFKELFPQVAKGIGEAADATRKLKEAQQELVRFERESLVESAKNNEEATRLRLQAADKENHTVSEREGMLQRALMLEKENLESNLYIAKERLRIAEEEAKQNNKKGKEARDRIAALTAEVYNVQANFNTGVKRLQNEYLAAQRENAAEAQKIIDEAKAKADEALKLQKERAQKTLEINRQLEDELLKLRASGQQLEIEQEQLATQRKIQELKKRLETEKNLSLQARSELDALIEVTRLNSAKKIAEIEDKYSKERLAKDIADEQNRISLLLDVATKGSDAELELRLQQIDLLRKTQLANAELTAIEIDAINRKYDLQEIEAKKQMIQKREAEATLALQNAYSERLIDVENFEVKVSEIELEQARARADYLLNLDEETKAALFESDEAWKEAQINARKAVIKAENDLIRAQQNHAQTQIKIMQTFGNAASDLLSALGNENEEFAVFTKALALFQIGANAAIGISEAIAAGAGLMFPANLAAIAAGVAAVTAAIVSAKQVLTEPPKFAKGGIVKGNQFTGDRVPIMANSGEMILTTAQQKNLFEGINMGTFGTGNLVENMRAAFADAISEMPPPLMDYSEFTHFEKQVARFTEKQII